MCTSCVSLYLAIYYVILIKGVFIGVKLVLLGISCMRLSVEFYCWSCWGGIIYYKLIGIGNNGVVRKGV